MGLFSFLRDVGAKLSGHGGAYSAPTPEALGNELKRLGLPADNIQMTVEGDTIHLSGRVPDAETREKVVLAVGNVEGVGKVDDTGLQGGEQTGSLGRRDRRHGAAPGRRRRHQRGRRRGPCRRPAAGGAGAGRLHVLHRAEGRHPVRDRQAPIRRGQRLHERSSRPTARCWNTRTASTPGRCCASRRAEAANADGAGQPTKRTGPA